MNGIPYGNLNGDFIVQRYLSFEKLEWLIKESSIYLSSVSSFKENDPREGSSTVVDYLEDSGWGATLDYCMNFSSPPSNLSIDAKKEREEVNKIISDDIDNKKFKLNGKEFSSSFYEGEIKKIGTEYYVSCWFKGQDESPEMWAYGEVVVFSSVDKLSHGLIISDDLDFVEIVEVGYINHDSERLKEKTNPLSSKDILFSHENEIRLIAKKVELNPISIPSKEEYCSVRILNLNGIIDKVLIRHDLAKGKICEIYNILNAGGIESHKIKLSKETAVSRITSSDKISINDLDSCITAINNNFSQ